MATLAKYVPKTANVQVLQILVQPHLACPQSLGRFPALHGSWNYYSDCAAAFRDRNRSARRIQFVQKREALRLEVRRSDNSVLHDLTISDWSSDHFTEA